jgi:rubrerythrin
MFRNKSLFLIVGIVAVICLIVPQVFAAKESKTLENLMSAYVGESNANAKYLAYAKKADEEGYGEVASLFRSAAKAEEIHAVKLSKEIKGMGGTPAVEIKLPEIKTTKENLTDALKGESYERDTMYPEFIKTAKKENKPDAIKVFNYAKAAETTHAAFYQDYLAKLDSLKGSKAKDFFVCGECGYTVVKVDYEKCPICFSPKDIMVKIS